MSVIKTIFTIKGIIVGKQTLKTDNFVVLQFVCTWLTVVYGLNMFFNFLV